MLRRKAGSQAREPGTSLRLMNRPPKPIGYSETREGMSRSRTFKSGAPGVREGALFLPGWNDTVSSLGWQGAGTLQ